MDSLRRSRFVLVLSIAVQIPTFATALGAFPAPRTVYVGPYGNDRTGMGSRRAPWASLRHASEAIVDGGTIVFLDGRYGPQSVARRFAKRVTVRAEHPYRAVWSSSSSNHRAFFIYGASNLTVTGFEIAGQPGGNQDYLVQITLPVCHDILHENNIVHDSYKNDILKLNDGSHHVTIRGNVFYNQPRGGDEHLDINTVHDIVVEQNVFFNDFAASGRPVANITHPFVLIKNSGKKPVSQNFEVRGNVFLNWQGLADQPFLLLGEDGQPFYEAQHVLVENNLFLGNTTNRITAAFAVKGARDVVFRANTIHGAFPCGSWAFAIRLGREGANLPNENITVVNNIFSCPDGSMTHFSSGSPSNTHGVTLRNNLYFNGGKPIPVDRDRVLNVTDDSRAVVANPSLPADLSRIAPPVWQAARGRFADGSQTIQEAHRHLVQAYGTPLAGSPTATAADGSLMPRTDILGHRRGVQPDLGAVEWEQ